MHEFPRAKSIGRIALFLVGCAGILIATSMIAPSFERPAYAELFTGVVASIATLGWALLLVRWDGLRLADVGAAFLWASPGRLAVGVLIGFVLVAAHTLVVATAGHVRWERDPVPASGQTVVLFALAYLCLAAREELAFHGYPLRCLQQLFGVWPAQFAIAIVFAAEHWLGGWSAGQAIWGAAVGSLLFGMASIATRGLAIPIGMHAAWNYFDWLRGNRAANGLWRPVIERGFEQSANLVGIVGYVCIMLLAVLAFWFWYRRGKTREKSEMDDS